jgi:hypothetical protein
MLKQREKCIKSATALVEEGTSVVVGKIMQAHLQLRLITAFRQHECGSRDEGGLDCSSGKAKRPNPLHTLHYPDQTLRA